MNKTLLSMALSALVLASCSPSDPPSGPLSPEPESFPLSVNNLAQGDGRKVLFDAYRAVTRFRPDFAVRQDQVHVTLLDANGQAVSGGTVTFNDQAVVERPGPHYQSIAHDVAPGPDVVQLRFDGSYQVFKVAGSELFPPLRR